MAAYHGRPEPSEYGAFYAGYLRRVPEGDILAQLREQIVETVALLRTAVPGREGFAYAPGKWTVREVVGHLCDVERVLAYRALRIARGDPTPLPAFDENAYVPKGAFERRALEDLLAELRTARNATVSLLEGLPPDAWERLGTVSGAPMSARAAACIIAGHERHHHEVLRTRYALGEGPTPETARPAAGG